MPEKNCHSCSEIIQKPKPMQKYCEPCSNKKDGERRPKKKGNPSPQRIRQLERGRQINKLVRPKLSDIFKFDENLHHKFMFKIPWDECPSKNAIWSQGRRSGHVFIREEIKANREKWANHIANHLKKHNYTFYPGKIWIDIFALKPSHKSDAINLIDNIADMIKVAIDVDDRWFCIRNLDWEIVTEDPCVYVGIAQEHDEEHFTCGYCRRITKDSDRSSQKRTCIFCQNGDLFKKELERLKTHGDNKGDELE